MGIGGAVAVMFEGRTVRRASWFGETAIALKRFPKGATIEYADRAGVTWMPRDQDILALDWEVVDD